MNKIRVLVADDNFLARQGLYGILGTEEDMECVAVAEDGEQAVKLARESCPDVAIIDVAMPNMNGIEATREIKKACPNTAILIISGYKYDHYVLACFEAGADGYLLKDNVLGESLTNAIRMIHAGENVFDREIIRIMRQVTVGKGKTGVGSGNLGSRELQVLKLATQGMGNKQIASELCISDQTVATHFVNIFRKLEVESRMEAVLHAIKKGWVNVDDLGGKKIG